METLASADAVLVVGASLNQFTMRFGELVGPGSQLVQVDVGQAATHPQVGRFIRGDARLVAEAMLAELGAASLATPWRDAAVVAEARRQDGGDPLAPDGRLDPRSAAERIGALLPENRVVVSDGGHFMGWPNMFWPVTAPDRAVMVGTAYQAIGLGFPSVAGAAVARPEATIVLVSGDGGGLMALADLETAVRGAGGRGLAVVWNDAAYGAEVTHYGAKGLTRGPMLIPEVDFAALAAAVGAEGVVIRTLDDLEALRDWTARPSDERPFLLLDLRISGTIVAPFQQEIVRQPR